MQHVDDSTAQLLEHQAAHTEVFSLKFLDWLVQEEEACTDAELKAQMSDFAGRLVSLRRGIVPTNARAAGTLPETVAEPEPTDVASFRRWPVQASWKPEYEVALYERVRPDINIKESN